MRLDPRMAHRSASRGAISAGGQNPRYNTIRIDGVSSQRHLRPGSQQPADPAPAGVDGRHRSDRHRPGQLRRDHQPAPPAPTSTRSPSRAPTSSTARSTAPTATSDWFGEDLRRRRRSPASTRKQTYGATFGGPIIKDKLFFFANYEKYTRTAPGTRPGRDAVRPRARSPIADMAEAQRHRARSLGLRCRRAGAAGQRQHRSRGVRAQARLEHQRQPPRQLPLQQAGPERAALPG